MDLWLDINGKYIPFRGPAAICHVKQKITDDFNCSDIYFVQNGKLLEDNCIVKEGLIHVFPRLRGGKGGFGSMLRAIGAQIEKTTNREACRDLSGRRLRDINEEKRLKNWIAQQAEREREAAERRKKKLERLCLELKHDFSDKSYEKERAELTEKVNDAVEQGFRSASSSCAYPKRKPEFEMSGPPEKKKSKCLWIDDLNENDLSSLDSSDSDSEISQPSIKNAAEKEDQDSPGPSGERVVCSTANNSENYSVVPPTDSKTENPSTDKDSLFNSETQIDNKKSDECC